MALLEVTLLILFGLSIATMFSGFMLARRMGMYLMMQVMMLMFAMFVSLAALVVGLLFTPSPLPFELTRILLILDFVLYLLAALMEFGQVLPILLKTMQGGPMHSSHITNLLLSLFLSLALALFYVDLATI